MTTINVSKKLTDCSIQHVHSGGALGDCPNLCLFAHYDKDGLIAPYVLFHIEQLKLQLNMETVFVSTSEALIENSQYAQLQELCPLVIRRDNLGLDFGSWKTAIDYLGWDKVAAYKSLLLTNDSIFGPLFDLTTVDVRPEAFQAEAEMPMVLGVTESFDPEYHLQSYFLYFNQAALLNEHFHKEWEDFRFLSKKQKIISHYEIGLSSRLKSYGFKVVPAFKNEDLRREFLKKSRALESTHRKYFELVRDKHPNPTHYMWKQLLGQKCPYVKVDLLKFNNEQIPDIADFSSLVAKNSNYDLELINQHLARFS